MMTVITRTVLSEGSEPEWDAAMHERLAAAERRNGWIGGQILIPLERMNERVIVGTWETRADWEAWHEDEAFKDTRRRLEQLEVQASETGWYEVVLDIRSAGPG
jgi:heme-degrading monooxygenase HmoA